MSLQYFLTCKSKYCALPIPLPSPPEKRANRIPWCKDSLPRNFVCPQCSHVYEYTIGDVQREFDETPDPIGNSIDSIFELEARCGNQNCVSPLYILQAGHESQRQAIYPSNWLLTPDFGIFRCSANHRVRTASFFERGMRQVKDWTWIRKYQAH